MVIAAATEAPRGGRSHAVRAHVAEGHGAWGLHWLICLFARFPRTVLHSSCLAW